MLLSDYEAGYYAPDWPAIVAADRAALAATALRDLAWWRAVWLALVAACALVTAAAFGATWITDLWTLGLALGGR